jgi:ABC-type Zn uptake system ZnuABC Zn-binding protein ZnuA
LTSFLPLYCFTINVTGSLAEVDNLLPAGVGPHDFQFAPRDLRRLEAADLIVVNGLNLEAWLDKALQSGAIRNPARVVRTAAGFERELIYTSSGAGNPADATAPARAQVLPAANPHAVPNPHVWLNPQWAAHAVTNILQALQQADPPNAARYAANAAGYLERLRRLDADIRRATDPLQHRAFITYHDAFPYFTRRYGLRVAGVIEDKPDVDPSPRHLARLSQAARQEHVTAIFTEREYSTQLADQLGRDWRARVAVLDTLETGPLVPTAYEDGTRRNLATLVKCLE